MAWTVKFLFCTGTVTLSHALLPLSGPRGDLAALLWSVCDLASSQSAPSWDELAQLLRESALAVPSHYLGMPVLLSCPKGHGSRCRAVF